METKVEFLITAKDNDPIGLAKSRLEALVKKLINSVAFPTDATTDTPQQAAVRKALESASLKLGLPRPTKVSQYVPEKADTVRDNVLWRFDAEADNWVEYETTTGKYGERLTEEELNKRLHPPVEEEPSPAPVTEESPGLTPTPPISTAPATGLVKGLVLESGEGNTHMVIVGQKHSKTLGGQSYTRDSTITRIRNNVVAKGGKVNGRMAVTYENRDVVASLLSSLPVGYYFTFSMGATGYIYAVEVSSAQASEIYSNPTLGGVFDYNSPEDMEMANKAIRAIDRLYEMATAALPISSDPSSLESLEKIEQFKSLNDTAARGENGYVTISTDFKSVEVRFIGQEKPVSIGTIDDAVKSNMSLVRPSDPMLKKDDKYVCVIKTRVAKGLIDKYRTMGGESTDASFWETDVASITALANEIKANQSSLDKIPWFLVPSESELTSIASAAGMNLDGRYPVLAPMMKGILTANYVKGPIENGYYLINVLYDVLHKNTQTKSAMLFTTGILNTLDKIFNNLRAGLVLCRTILDEGADKKSSYDSSTIIRDVARPWINTNIPEIPTPETTAVETPATPVTPTTPQATPPVIEEVYRDPRPAPGWSFEKKWKGGVTAIRNDGLRFELDAVADTYDKATGEYVLRVHEVGKPYAKAVWRGMSREEGLRDLESRIGAPQEQTKVFASRHDGKKNVTFIYDRKWMRTKNYKARNYKFQLYFDEIRRYPDIWQVVSGIPSTYSQKLGRDWPAGNISVNAESFHTMMSNTGHSAALRPT